MSQKFTVLEDILVAGLVINNNQEFLVVQEKDDKYTFPCYPVVKMPGKTWEVLEKILTENLAKTTGITIQDGLIPFTDQAFIGKEGFEQIIMFYVCKYQSGELSKDSSYKDLLWQKFADFQQDLFKPLVYQVFQKANDFVENLTKITI